MFVVIYLKMVRLTGVLNFKVFVDKLFYFYGKYKKIV